MMKFSDRFLSALGGWQRGWREDRAQRLERTHELTEAVNAENLPLPFRSVGKVCYRKRYLIPNNPQNGGDLGPLFINGFIEEGLASWTTEEKFAQEFKDPLRDGTFSAVFAHLPKSGEVLVNIPSLWADKEFVEAVNTFHARRGTNADALMNFKFRQGEIVIDAHLQYLEIESLCGRSSPFDVLCEAAGLSSEDEKDSFWKQLVAAGKYPESPLWLSVEATRDALDRSKAAFFQKHGATIATAMANRSQGA